MTAENEEIKSTSPAVVAEDEPAETQELSVASEEFTLPVSILNVDDESADTESNDETADLSHKSRRSVFSAVGLDGLSDVDFSDQGRLAGKPEADVDRIMQQIKNIVLFEGYDEDDLRLVIDYMYVTNVSAGEVVIKFGSTGNALYVVNSGSYQCTVPRPDGTEETVQTYCDDGFFGELALINHAPRAANVTATTKGQLWVLNALRNSWIRKNQAIFNAERFDHLIGAIPIFRDNLNPALRSRLIDTLEVTWVDSGELICRQGDPGDAMYFIMSGEVEVTIDGRTVKVMQRNEFFGERALLLGEGRAASCAARTKVKLARLQKGNFDLVMPDAVIDIMRQNIATNYGPPASIGWRCVIM